MDQLFWGPWLKQQEFRVTAIPVYILPHRLGDL